MFTLPYLCICVYCMLQTCFLIFMDIRCKNTLVIKGKYFRIMMYIILFSFVADIISSFWYEPAWIIPFARAGNYVEIILNAILPPTYFLYVGMQINGDDGVLKRRLTYILWGLAILCSVIVISTKFTGQIFYFDKYGAYHRGKLFCVLMSIFLIMIVIIEGYILSQKSRIEEAYFKSLALFMVFPVIGLALQFFVFGMPFSLISVTFAAQVVFINVQNRSIDIDYLTGVFNRQSLDKHMQNKIYAASIKHSFSAILVDIDDFKSINDKYGHYQGDIALKAAVNILRSSIGRKDFIARYGGDEFCIVLNSNDSPQKVINTIEDNLLEFNRREDKLYNLSFSMGYETYHPSMGNRNDQFFSIIDQKMYLMKKVRKENKSNAFTI